MHRIYRDGKDKLTEKLILSAADVPDEGELESVLRWVEEKNRSLKVRITKNRLSHSDKWFYDEKTGEIHNSDNSFFSIGGLRQYRGDELILEQPVLHQREIGYLGIICKEMDGVLHFLMQAKIEPGNVNKIQISPTIQATKSNFTQLHGGRKPAYLDFFLNASPENIIVDQIQSEQSSRFLGKRNRNIIIMTSEDVEVLPSHRWMTLGMIKRLMKYDNLVNMDTRTVLSCIPYSLYHEDRETLDRIEKLFTDKELFASMFCPPRHSSLVKVFRYMNDYRMLHSCKNVLVPLMELESWEMSDEGICHKTGYPFKVIFCDIEIEGREVTQWTQPLFEAQGMAVFGLITSVIDGRLQFLVHAKAEAGCFDGIELAPTVQLEAGVPKEKLSSVDRLFFRLLEEGAEKRSDVILSEEGGRFYHEQNRNIILRVPADRVGDIPEGYFWLDYSVLNNMVQFNNVLNIQLRNLLSLTDI